MTEQRAVCRDNPVAIDMIIDSPRNKYLTREVAAMCETPCPLASTCLHTTREQDENWHPVAYNIRKYIKAKAEADAA